MKTPAITNQYGDMYTGMPSGRAMTIPGPPARRCGFSGGADDWSGVRLATSPMLRARAVARVDAARRDPPECRHRALRWRCGRNSGCAGPGGRPPGAPLARAPLARALLARDPPARDPRGRGRTSLGAVTFSGGRLYDLPASVQVPGYRPAARAAHGGDRARDAGARRAGAAVRLARRGPDPGGGAGAGDPRVGAAGGGRTRSGRALSRRDRAGYLAQGRDGDPGRLLHPGR